MSRALLSMLLAVTLSACVELGSSTTIQPRGGRSGMQLTGRIDGQPIAVTEGLPRLDAADCDPNDGVDEDVCVVSRTIDGTLFVLVLENPAVLRPGTTLDVADRPCPRPSTCDAVDDVAIVDVQLGTGRRVRATGGTLELEVVEPAMRYRGSLLLQFPDGTLTGDFDVIPRPESEA
jgi:hypothetical protein